MRPVQVLAICAVIVVLVVLMQIKFPSLRFWNSPVFQNQDDMIAGLAKFSNDRLKEVGLVSKNSDPMTLSPRQIGLAYLTLSGNGQKEMMLRIRQTNYGFQPIVLMAIGEAATISQGWFITHQKNPRSALQKLISSPEAAKLKAGADKLNNTAEFYGVRAYVWAAMKGFAADLGETDAFAAFNASQATLYEPLLETQIGQAFFKMISEQFAKWDAAWSKIGWQTKLEEKFASISKVVGENLELAGKFIGEENAQFLASLSVDSAAEALGFEATIDGTAGELMMATLAGPGVVLGGAIMLAQVGAILADTIGKYCPCDYPNREHHGGMPICYKEPGSGAGCRREFGKPKGGNWYHESAGVCAYCPKHHHLHAGLCYKGAKGSKVRRHMRGTHPVTAHKPHCAWGSRGCDQNIMSCKWTQDKPVGEIVRILKNEGDFGADGERMFRAADGKIVSPRCYAKLNQDVKRFCESQTNKKINADKPLPDDQFKCLENHYRVYGWAENRKLYCQHNCVPSKAGWELYKDSIEANCAMYDRFSRGKCEGDASSGLCEWAS